MSSALHESKADVSDTAGPYNIAGGEDETHQRIPTLSRLRGSTPHRAQHRRRTHGCLVTEGVSYQVMIVEIHL